MLKVFLLAAALVAGVVAVLFLTLEPSNEEGVLIVQTASGGSVTANADGNFTLLMTDVGAVVWFSDRPDRRAGTMSLDDFVSIWQTDDVGNDFPNAALEVNGSVYLIELVEVTLDAAASSLTYEVTALDRTDSTGALQMGELAEIGFGPAALFIDPVVNPQITD